MPGIFSKTARPLRPGAYFNWTALPTITILPNIGSIVLLPIVHDWGPPGVPVATVSLADFQNQFGPTNTTPGYKAVAQAFEGENVYGRGGAGQVIVYRMVNAAGASGSKVIQNTTPATAITLTARYPGSYGNNLGYIVKQNAVNPATQNDLQITLSGIVVETYTHLKASLAPLVAAINAGSQWVTASLQLDGVALPTVITASTPLTGGLDGSTLVALDWTNMMTACGPLRFSLFAPYDLTDPTILASIQAWAVNANLAGRRFLSVVGGAVNETAAAAVARSATLQSIPVGPPAPPSAEAQNFVNLGVGSLIDTALGTLSTSQLAPRIAGILAARGEAESLTFARLAGTLPGVMPIDSDVLAAFSGGVVVFGQDSNPDAPIRVEKGLTTYIGGDTTKPYLIYRNPKFVRTMHGIELEITDWAAANAVGLLQVNAATRAYILGHAREVIDARAKRGVIQQGYTLGIDQSPPASDNDEFVALVYGIAFGRSVEQVFNTVYIS